LRKPQSSRERKDRTLRDFSFFLVRATTTAILKGCLEAGILEKARSYVQ